MNARNAVGLFALSVAFLLTGTAMAQNVECEPIEARFGPSIYLPPCDFQGVTYGFCIDADTSGDLEGVWHYYGTLDNFVEVLNPMPNHPGIVVGWSLSAFATADGEIWTQDQWGTHADLPAVIGEWIFSQTSLVIGGTGKYEGASGWLGLSGTEIVGGIIEGQLCTIDDD